MHSVAALIPIQRLVRQARLFPVVLLLIIFIAFTLPPGVRVLSNTSATHPDPSSASVHRTFWLNGTRLYGWNHTIPGPTMMVSSGDVVTIMLLSADGDVHNWYVDANQSATTSPIFYSTVVYVNFTFTPVIRGNFPMMPVYNETIFPRGGDWTYLCLYHLGTMYGTFRLLPAASFVYTPSSPLVEQSVSFDGSASKPSIGAGIASYSWDFGDGNRVMVSSPTITHTYSSVVRFTVSLTITDNVSNNDTTSRTVTVTAPGIDLNATPTSDTAPVNSQANSTIIVASNGTFTGAVDLSETSSPATGLACTFTPNSIVLGTKGNSTLSCSSSDAIDYSIAVLATSGTVGNVTSVIFSFQDFQIAASSPVQVNPGAPSTSTITITALNGFFGVVYLTDAVPSDVTCGAITPSSITGSGSATVSCTASQTGNYTLTVTGTAGTTHASSFVLKVVQRSGGSALSFTSMLEIGGLVAAVVAVVAVFLFLRRRRPKQ